MVFLHLAALLTFSGVRALGQDSRATPPPTPEKQQANPPPAAPNQTPNPNQKSDNNAEVSVHDSETTFRIRVNLVQVRVVVRDPSGKPVKDLTRGDFLVYDQGKLQELSTFAVETPESRREKVEAATKTQAAEPGAAKPTGAVLPDRFIALVFDDSHISLEDSNYVRQAANKFLDEIAPTDRVGIFTTSGQVTHEFTSDAAALKRPLLGISPRPKLAGSFSDCPDISHYMADQIENKQNAQVLSVAAEETLQCQFEGDRTKIALAQELARSASIRALHAGDTENMYVFRYLEDILRRLAGSPGERVMLLVSPGFQLTSQTIDALQIIDRANRANIVINTLDVRGLYVPDLMGDISKRSTDSFRTAGFKGSYRIEAQTEQQYVLGDFAYGTGGSFFHNSNDLAGGLKMLGAAPEAAYVLGFSPQKQKMDGTFHTLKVTLTGKRKLDVQARRGYYAPRKFDDPKEQERTEIQEAVFSRDEILDLPLDLQTQYFKTEGAGASLSVVSKLNLKGMRFRKADGRNVDKLTIATVVFDEDGNYVSGTEKILDLHLLDATYEKLMRSGLTVKSSFKVKPGKYMVRQVVRDTEGAQMAARNGAVSIPY